MCFIDHWRRSRDRHCKGRGSALSSQRIEHRSRDFRMRAWRWKDVGRGVVRVAVRVRRGVFANGPLL